MSKQEITCPSRPRRGGPAPRLPPPCPWLHLDVVTAPDGTTIRHAQLVPPGAEPLLVESLGEVAVYEDRNTGHTCELFLLMTLTPENSDEVTIVSLQKELPPNEYTVLGP